jgi:hypothetical protein
MFFLIYKLEITELLAPNFGLKNQNHRTSGFGIMKIFEKLAVFMKELAN